MQTPTDEVGNSSTVGKQDDKSQLAKISEAEETQEKDFAISKVLDE